MQELNFRLLFGCLYFLAYSVTFAHSTRQRPDHFLIGNATLSANTTAKDVNDDDGDGRPDGPFTYKGVKGGPACTVESSNISESPQIQVYIRHDNIRSMSFGTGYAEHSSMFCSGKAENYCTAFTKDALPRESNRSCYALVEECACEPEPRLLSKAHQIVTKEIRQLCYKAPELRDLYTDPYRILIVGLSSGALPMYLMSDCRVFVPGGLKLSIVEPDTRVVDLAHGLFGFSAISSVAEIETADPKKAILERLLEPDHVKYDIVIIDLADGDGGLPESVQGPAFLEGIDRLLRPGSQVMHYVPAKDYNQTISDYIAVFGKDYLQEYQTGMSREEGPEHVVVAHGPPILAKSSTWVPAVGLTKMIILGLSCFLDL